MPRIITRSRPTTLPAGPMWEPTARATAPVPHATSASWPTYELAYKLTQLLPPTANEQPLFGALLGNDADTTAFFGALVSTVPIPSFFGPENIGRIVGAAMSRVG